MASTSGSTASSRTLTSLIQQQNVTTSNVNSNSNNNMAAGSTVRVTSNPVNSRSISTASVSSDGSNGSYVENRPEMLELTNDAKLFKDSLANLKKVFNTDIDSTETLRVACHERLGEVLKILRSIMERYPHMQSSELVHAAGALINQVKEVSSPRDEYTDLMFRAVDTLAITFHDRFYEYMTGDIDSTTSSASSKEKEALQAELDGMTLELKEEEDSFGPDQIDNLLMRHYQGVDHALKYAKNWAKYAKDIINYVDKRADLEKEWARGLAKLAQSTRPILKEESYLPFQSVYCTALDQDLEMCASTHATCNLLQGNKFIEPLSLKRSEHQKTRKIIKDRWTRELKILQETVSNLKKAKSLYVERNKDYERCREAVRIAEQGAEIGATGENKVDKRKRLEEEALQKTEESKVLYKNCVDEANEKHRQLLVVKSEILQQIRELVLQCDHTVKNVTVSYFQMQHNLTAPIAVQFQALQERSRMVEPGSQFTEFVRFGLGEQPPPSRFSTSDPFNFEPYTDDNYLYFDIGQRRRTSVPVDVGNEDYGSGTYKMKGEKVSSGSMMAWTSSMGGPIEPSDTDSSGNTSPSASPMIPSRHLPPGSGGGGGMASSEEVEIDGVLAGDTNTAAAAASAAAAAAAGGGHHYGSSDVPVGVPLTVPRRSFAISKAAKTHKFRKVKTPSKCRECDSYVLRGLDCQECGLSAHKKCLEVLILRCGHRRLPARMKTFGVDLQQHLLETGAHVAPVVCKCVSEIDKRGLKLEGIYRKSGAKTKIDKIREMFEIAPELVELSDVQLFVIADVLRNYFRELPESLITFQLLPEFINVAKNLNVADCQESQAVQELTELCRKLPKSHFRTLAFLMHHLNRVARESEENNMPASNLAIVFAPTLMKTSEESAATLSSLSHEGCHQNKILELLILNATAIFGSPESVLPKDYSKYTAPSVTSTEAMSGALSGKRGGGGRAKNRKYGSSSGAELMSSQTERRSIDTHDEYHALPGHVISEHVHEDYLSDEDEDAEAIPSFLLPDDSSKTKKSPLLNRGNSSPPKIIKSSLKSFSGLEGVTAERLSTQDSLENAQRLSKQASADHHVMAANHPSSRKSIPHESSSSIIRHHRTSETLFSRVGKVAKKHSLDEDFLSPPIHPPLSDRLSSEAGFVSSGSAPPSSSHQDTTVTRNTPSPGEDNVDGAAGGGTEVLRSSTSPGSGRTSLTIGIGSASSGSSSGSMNHPGRSSSLSDDHQGSMTVAEQRRKFLASTSTDGGAAAVTAAGAGGGGNSNQYLHHSKGGPGTSISQPSISSSLPTNIPNLEENKVKIQVTGGIPSSSRYSGGGSTIVKQSSIDKGTSS